MRRRYFLISLFIFFVLSILTTALNHFFLYQERMNMINQSLRDAATALLDSDFGVREVHFEKADSIISDELGESRVGKFFFIRNSKGEILFESASAKLLKINDPPQTPQWLTLKREGKFIRILNLALPRIDNRTLQVGVALDEQWIYPTYFSRNTIFFFLSILLCGFICAYFLTSSLLKPIQSLNKYLTDILPALREKEELPDISPELKSYLQKFKDGKDEFVILLQSFNRLTETLNRQHKMTRQWTYQLAHELKTPIAILEIETEKLVSQGSLTQEHLVPLNLEMSKLNEILSSFLSWAELENVQKQKSLHGINVSKYVRELVERFNRIYPGRLELDINNEFDLLCNSRHFEQALVNLVTNALNYSSVDKVVKIKVTNHLLTIADEGEGLTAKVLERLGEPFNSGHRGTGHGLGLAWVFSIARLYQWRIDYKTDKSGTIFWIYFPEV